MAETNILYLSQKDVVSFDLALSVTAVAPTQYQRAAEIGIGT